MATRSSRPGRTLTFFTLIVAAMFVAAAAVGGWTPRLGLDLQGGQRITLQAKSEGGGGITSSKLDEAVGIINDRVNGAGVAESEVSTQGDDIIVIEIPGTPDEDLQRSIGSTAQLRFRLVAFTLPPEGAQTDPPQTPSTPADPSSTTDAPGPTEPTSSGEEPTNSPDKPSDTTKPKATGSGKNRVSAPWLTDKPAIAQAPSSGAPTTTPTAEETPSVPTTPTADATPTAPTAPTEPTETGGAGGPTSTTPTSDGPPAALVPPDLEQIKDPYAWVNLFQGQSPPTEWLSRLAAYDCANPDPSQPGQLDIPEQPLLACDDDGQRYLLGPSMVDGTDVTDASAGIPQGGVNYVVNVDFNGDGAKLFGEVTSRIAGTGQQLAIVLDGQVLSAPQNQQPITGGQAEISGSSADPFTQDSATSLSNSLKYGALPLSFTIVNSSLEGPQLASNQLDAGIQAGIIGLLLVLVYCVLYYRGLSIVIVASLVIAGLMTYASVLLLGHAYGFTLTLPGIAGLIVAVGITADSFIVYFERLRDEVREGRTLRTSVETGWVRARATIVAADAVSLLAAVVLFVFAIGVVKGFAFALGLSTVVDLFVVFFFTKPMVTLLSRTKFFGQGHKLSGLDRQHLGMPPTQRAPRTAGGEA